MNHITAMIDQNQLAKGGLKHSCINNYTKCKVTKHWKWKQKFSEWIKIKKQITSTYAKDTLNLNTLVRRYHVNPKHNNTTILIVNKIDSKVKEYYQRWSGFHNDEYVNSSRRHNSS